MVVQLEYSQFHHAAGTSIMFLKHVATLLAVVFGFLGAVACLAGIYGVWLVRSRLEEINVRVFSVVDNSLVSATDRLRSVQKRIEEAKITSNEIETKVRDWSLRKAKETLALRIEIETRTEKLARHLETADTWLETSTEWIRSVQEVLELGNKFGGSADPSSFDDVVEKLDDVRSKLQQTGQTIDGIRTFLTGKSEESEDTRFSRVMKLLGRLLLTTAEIDTRLESTVTRLTELQTDAQRYKARTSNYILAASIACCLLLAWIGAGQVALCRCGWKFWRGG
jgi:DNA-binding transcriptional MerR regulator